METKKLSLKGFACAFSLLWGLAVGMVAVTNMIRPGYGAAFLAMVASIYPFYDGTATIPQVLKGTAFALFDGFFAGLIFAWLYNICSGYKKCQQ